MKRLFTIVICVLSISCSDKRALSPENPRENITGLLNKITMKSGDTILICEYDYKDNLTLNRITYSGNNQKVAESFIYENDTLKFSIMGDTVKRYIYENARLKYLDKFHSIDSNDVYRSIYSYYVTGQIFSIEKKRIRDLKEEYLSEVHFSWLNNNVVNMKVTASNWSIEETKFSFGETADPLNHLFFKILRIPPDGLVGLSQNNFSVAQIVSSGLHFKSEEIVNDRGQVIRKYLFQQNSDGNWDNIKDYLYEYNDE